MFCKTCGNGVDEKGKFCMRCGAGIFAIKDIQNKKILIKKKIIIGGLVLTFFGLLFMFFQSKSPLSIASDKEIAASIVNIYCQNESGDNAFGGSGTVMSEDGLILTNAHIIPTNIDENALPFCLVILPDPDTGAPDEIYTAYPVVIPEISEQYDLAFVQIDDVFVDDEGIVHGDYPKTFPAYDGNKYCRDENVILGERVKIYGYPAISGGYALTITDGLVSSLLMDEGLIITSAKVSQGNSGGIAVDQYGCMLGVPSMVTGDENESLGVIISNDLISEFYSELELIINSE